ncbi:Succinate dehydrogenase assembly factor 2, mitochondrial [Glycine soja]|uniref:Succinate dehydrogenase assembly factor 2, mitochondrial n=1 Tax=Glycine soja TaxID=3848 RepID=A0A445KYM4_GLYSO|nr:Succinate dehydrogenase assembly factor 2, mitochondrial [Glycine soja]
MTSVVTFNTCRKLVMDIPSIASSCLWALCINRNPNGALQSCLMVLASFRNAAINVFRVINSKKSHQHCFHKPPSHSQVRFTPFLSHTQNQALEIDLSNEESKRHLFNQLLYRSKQRGFLELDLVLGKWVEAGQHSLLG